jgi:hypothetical protein
MKCPRRPKSSQEFQAKSVRLLAFSLAAKAGENVRMGGNGGGLETRI